MEPEKDKNGNFSAFRAGLITDHQTAKQKWVDHCLEIRSLPEGAAKTEKVKQGLRLMDVMEGIAEEIYSLECQQVEKQLGKALVNLGIKIYNEILVSQRSWSEAELARLEVLRKEGMSYSERMKKINPERLQRVLVVDKGDISFKNIELRPIEVWLEPITGYDRLKEMGVTNFVTRNFSMMFNIKK